jgi:hypothetical protein
MVLFQVNGIGVYKAHYALALINDTFRSRAEVAQAIFATQAPSNLITQLNLRSGASVLFGDFGSLTDSLSDDDGSYFDSTGYVVYKDEKEIANILAEIEANTRDSFDQAGMDTTDLVFNGSSFWLAGVEKYASVECSTAAVELWEVGLAPAPQEVTA